jgi:BMFP domain-containing protein YqiC
MLLEVIGAIVSGFFHRLGIKLGDTLARSKQKESRRILDQPVADLDMPDQEVWNIVTSYGKYKEVWPIYRNNGLLEAIKARDEKAEFDQKMSEIGNPKQSSISPTQQNPSSKHIQKKIPPVVQESQRNLDELDLALVRGLASYFEEMNGKIRHYHRDHHASREEADVVASYYLKTAGVVRRVKTRQDLEELLESINKLKEKVSRYQHDSYKYRWSTGLEEEVVVKLNKIMDTLNA